MDGRRRRPVIRLGGMLLAALAGWIAPAVRAESDSPREGPRPLAASAVGVGRWLPPMEFIDRSGNPARLGPSGKSTLQVVALTSLTCPVSRRYAPTLRKLERAYGPRGVEFVFLDPTVTETGAKYDARVAERALAGPWIPDPEGRHAARLGATSTTEVLVLDAARTLLYRGAVDDEYGLGYSLPAPRRRFLVDALDAALAGERPPVAATTAPGCVLEGSADRMAGAGRNGIPVTFHNRVSRILQQHCGECHRDGGVAPFPLATRADLLAHAGMVRRQVERGFMPPWFAAPGPDGTSGVWANDRSLPEADRADLLAWLDGGREDGDPADAPRPRAWPEGWAIGTPDAVVELPEEIAIPATGEMPYQNLFVKTDFGEDRWVRAWEVQPTAREVVHHVLVFVIPPEDATPEKLRRSAGSGEGGGFFAVYVPGTSHQRYPDGFAKRIPAGATLHFQVHYTPRGTPAADRTRLGLVFASDPPRHVVEVAGIANVLIDIPPGAADHRETARLRVPLDAELLALFPHMHLRGKAFRFDLVDPDGARRTLLDVPRYDFNWQLTYRFADAVRAVKDSRIEAIGWFDNSTGNPANPDPARRVRWGPQTDDEMLIGYVEYYVPGIEPSVAATERPNPLVGREWERFFDQLDADGDGRWAPSELPGRLSAMMPVIDANGDGYVTRDELGVAVRLLRQRGLDGRRGRDR